MPHWALKRSPVQMWHLLNYRGMNGNAAIMLRAGEVLLKYSKTAKCPPLDACFSLLEVVCVVESWAWSRQWGHGWMLWGKWRWGKWQKSVSAVRNLRQLISRRKTKFLLIWCSPATHALDHISSGIILCHSYWWTSGVLCMWFYSLLFSFICFYSENSFVCFLFVTLIIL